MFLQVEELIGHVPFEISYGSDAEEAPRMLKTKFGDGYEQRMMDGVNTTPLILAVTFSNRRQLVISHIRRFLRGDPVLYPRTPNEFFYFIPVAPFSDDGVTPLKFKCETWKVGSDQWNNFTLSAKFEQVFEA